MRDPPGHTSPFPPQIYLYRVATARAGSWYLPTSFVPALHLPAREGRAGRSRAGGGPAGSGAYLPLQEEQVAAMRPGPQASCARPPLLPFLV